jgi:uncharacterized membrane protein
MAGIGFELRRILESDTFGAWTRAYAFGAVIVLGPFFCSVLCLAGISYWTHRVVELEVRQMFTGATVMVFGASLVFTGAVQVVLTRYLADLVYRGQHDRVMSSLFPALALSCLCLSITGLPFIAFVPLSTLQKLILWSLLMTVGGLWIVVVFITSSEGHEAVVAVFFLGSAIALASSLALASRYGFTGLLAGYAAGQWLILVLLVRHLIVELGYPSQWDWGVLKYFRQFPSLIAIGVLQSLGVWIDKVVFWSSSLAVGAGGFVTAPKYDSATFLGFLTCVPALTHFFVRIEADFSQHFHDYFDQIFFRRSLNHIVAAATQLRRSVIAALLDIFKVQGVISFLASVFAVTLLGWAGLPLSEVGMFRFAVIGALFLSFTLFSNVILLYLDRRKEVLITCILFVGSNLALSLLSLELGYSFYGAGFAASSLLAMVSSLVFLTDQLFNLEYRTFVSIPVIGRHSGRRLLARPGGLYGRYNAVEPDVSH